MVDCRGRVYEGSSLTRGVVATGGGRRREAVEGRYGENNSAGLQSEKRIFYLECGGGEGQQDVARCKQTPWRGMKRWEWRSSTAEEEMRSRRLEIL